MWPVNNKSYLINSLTIKHSIVIACLCFISTVNAINPIDFYQPKPGENQKQLRLESYHLNLAARYVNEKQLAPAWGELNYVLHAIPNHPEALKQISALAVQSGDYGHAHAYFQQALTLFPHQAQTHYLYAEFLSQIADFYEAIKRYQSALAITPDDPSIHYGLGLSYVQIQNYPLAQHHANRAYALGATDQTLAAVLSQQTNK